MRVEHTSYGRAASEALWQAIRAAKGGEPLSPVTVVVPSNHVGVAARRLLASGGLGPICDGATGLAAVTFLTVYRLAELLGAAALAAQGRRPVSTPVVAAAVRAALADDPGLFADVAAHPATETALVTAYRELRDISDGALDALASSGERASDVVRLCRATRARLAGGWYDEEDLMTAAMDARHAGAARAAADLGQVIVHLPQRMSRHGAALLAAVASGTSEVTVLAALVGDGRIDGDVLTTLARLGAPAPTRPVAVVATLPGLGAEASTPAPVAPPPPLPVDAGRTRIVTTSDADEEVRAAVRAVLDSIRQGTPLDRIAVLHASPQPYARMVFEQLRVAGVECNGAAVVPLTGRVAGRALLQLLALPAGGYRREEVFAWLAGAPVHWGRAPAPVTAWERLSREAGIAGGRDWDVRLRDHAAVLDGRADALEADTAPDTSRPVRSHEVVRHEAERCRSLHRFMQVLMADLADGRAPRSWADHAGWARTTLERILGPVTGRDDRWPEVERKAAEKVETSLDRLAALEGLEGPVTLEVFTRTLTLELEADLGRVGRFGEGVLVGDIGMGIGLDLDLVVILGLAEGSFPAPVRDDSLLPDGERERCAGQLDLRSARIDRQHRQLRAAMAGAARQVLTIPRGDLRRSSERVPSRWALDVASALAGHRMWSADLLSATHPWLTHIASFDEGLRTCDPPATEQEHRLRSLLAAGATGKGASLLTNAADGALSRAAAVVAARRSSEFTRFDGNLDGCDVPSPIDQVMSSSRLELWARCPYSYFTRHVLRAEAIENPEDELEITPADKGTLVHEILESFIAEVLARDVDEQPAPTTAWTAHDTARLHALADDALRRFEQTGRTGRPVFWRRDQRRIRADLDRILTEDDTHRRDHSTRPLAAELAFGLDGAGGGLPAVELSLPDGRVLRFRGKADRVDRADDGTLHVVDYKTGSRKPFEGLSEDDPDKQGQKLQLPVYGQAARLLAGADPQARVRAEYWFVSTKGAYKRRGYDVTPEVLDRVGHTLLTIVDGIGHGVFPARPTDDGAPWVDCPACDPDALGTADLRRAWEHKRAHPALAAYAGLAEPLEAIEPEFDDTLSPADDADA